MYHLSALRWILVDYMLLCYTYGMSIFISQRHTIPIIPTLVRQTCILARNVKYINIIELP